MPIFNNLYSDRNKRSSQAFDWCGHFVYYLILNFIGLFVCACYSILWVHGFVVYRNDSMFHDRFFRLLVFICAHLIDVLNLHQLIVCICLNFQSW